MEIHKHLTTPEWREVNIMAIGLLGGRYPEKAGRVVERVLADPGTADAVVLMGDAVADGGANCVPEATRERLGMALLAVMRNDTVPATTRAKAGTALADVGDPRFDPEMWFLPVRMPDVGADGNLPPEPLLGFIEIPAGPFWMGSDLEAPKKRRRKV